MFLPSQQVPSGSQQVPVYPRVVPPANYGTKQVPASNYGTGTRQVPANYNQQVIMTDYQQQQKASQAQVDVPHSEALFPKPTCVWR